MVFLFTILQIKTKMHTTELAAFCKLYSELDVEKKKKIVHHEYTTLSEAWRLAKHELNRDLKKTKTNGHFCALLVNIDDPLSFEALLLFGLHTSIFHPISAIPVTLDDADICRRWVEREIRFNRTTLQLLKSNDEQLELYYKEFHAKFILDMFE